MLARVLCSLTRRIKSCGVSCVFVVAMDRGGISVNSRSSYHWRRILDSHLTLVWIRFSEFCSALAQCLTCLLLGLEDRCEKVTRGEREPSETTVTILRKAKPRTTHPFFRALQIALRKLDEEPSRLDGFHHMSYKHWLVNFRGAHVLVSIFVDQPPKSDITGYLVDGSPPPTYHVIIR